jgi:hypothetical protein
MQPIRAAMSLPKVIRTTFSVLLRRPSLQLAGVLPLLPGVVLLWVLFPSFTGMWGLKAAPVTVPLLSSLPVWALVALTLGVLCAGLVSCYVMTVRIVADACEGRQTTVASVLRDGFGLTALKSALTWMVAALALLPAVAIPAGANYLLLAGPSTPMGKGALAVGGVLALVAVVNLMFAPVIVVVEGRWAVGALRRSVELAWGRNLRNFAVLAALWLTLMGIAVGAGVGISRSPLTLPPSLVSALPWLVQLLMAPFYSVLLSVLYYDMRARNGESFGPAPAGKAFPDPPKLQQDGHTFGALPPKSRMRVASRGGGTRNM